MIPDNRTREAQKPAEKTEWSRRWALLPPEHTECDRCGHDYTEHNGGRSGDLCDLIGCKCRGFL